MQQHAITRENISYTISYGMDVENRLALWIDGGVQDGQPVRYFCTDFSVSLFSHTYPGRTESIQTRWIKVMISNSGQPIWATAEKFPMTTVFTDFIAFEQALGGMIQRFLVNGFVRETLGFNFQPAFDGQGAPILDAAFNTAAQPSGNYQTHKVDGTPIPGRAESAIDITPWMATGTGGAA